VVATLNLQRRGLENLNVIAAGRGLEADAMHQEGEASRAGDERGRNRPTRHTGIIK
jgi:hypothetical protein